MRTRAYFTVLSLTLSKKEGTRVINDTKVFPPVKRKKDRRIAVILLLFTVSLLVLLLRLYVLAAVDMRAKAVLDGQYTRHMTVASHGGFVFDRDGTQLSHNEHGAVALIDPHAVKNVNELLDRLPVNDAKDLAHRLGGSLPFAVRLESMPDKTLPDGAYAYPLYAERTDAFCRHLLGSRNGEGRGISGVYGRFDELLLQYDAAVECRYETDAAGQTGFDGTMTVYDNGYDARGGLILTLRADMQQALETVCDVHKLDKGAAVLCRADTGELLAVLSRPTYDPTHLSDYLGSTDGELLNRTFCTYTPGSVFKLVVAAAAIECDPTLLDMEYTCTGDIDIGGVTFHCHNRSGHGEETLMTAFANSCNPYFITLAGTLGMDVILRTAERLGFGRSRVLEGMRIGAGVLPIFGKRYPLAYQANFAFGQGELTATPMDILSAVCAAYTGYAPTFSYLRGITDGKTTELFDKPGREKIYSEETVHAMREMMRLCVTDGTGRAAFVRDVYTCGKTATAQSGIFRNGSELLHRMFAGVFDFHGTPLAMVVLFDGEGDTPGTPAEVFADAASALQSLPELSDEPQ